jgi:predicted SAM-dependent methyltransferase
MQRLNIGCADVQPEDWCNLDRDDFGQEYVCDLLEGLPFEDNYFDYIVSNHQIQMTRFHDLPEALAELRRVLKPGAVLRVLVPDFEKALAAYDRVDYDYFPIDNSLAQTRSGKLLRYIFWHGDARSAFTLASLQEILTRARFVNCQGVPYGHTVSRIPEITELDSRETESLIVEGWK